MVPGTYLARTWHVPGTCLARAWHRLAKHRLAKVDEAQRQTVEAVAFTLMTQMAAAMGFPRYLAPISTEMAAAIGFPRYLAPIS
jgi:hypothetical protein